jgi:hypothetical protein
MNTIPFFPYADLLKRDEAALTEIMMGVCRRGAFIQQQECLVTHLECLAGVTAVA